MLAPPWVHAVAFNPATGTLFYVDSSCNTIREVYLDGTTGPTVFLPDQGTVVTGLAFTATGDLAISMRDTGMIHLYDSSADPDEDFTLYLQVCEVTYEFIYEFPFQDEFLFGCLGGDGYILRVHLDFDDATLSGNIEPDRITLDAPVSAFTFWSDGPNVADSAATLENGYATTITHSYVSGNMGCGTEDLAVRLDGIRVGEVESLTVKSPDYDGNGTVGLSDLCEFGFSYGTVSGAPGYNDCFDFTMDGAITLSDLSFLGAHYTHAYSPPGSACLAGAYDEPAVELKYRVERVDDVKQRERLFIILSLADADDVSTIAFGLDRDTPGLEYVGWMPSPDFPGVPVALTTTSHDCNVLFVAAFAMTPAGRGEIEIGTLEFAIEDIGALSTCDKCLGLVFGEALGADRMVRRIECVEHESENAIPVASSLAGNYPNPFNPSTVVEYSIAADSPVNIAIYDVAGRLVCTLVDEFMACGAYTVIWDGTDNRGAAVSTGVYFYRLVAGGDHLTKKMVLLR